MLESYFGSEVKTSWMENPVQSKLISCHKNHNYRRKKHQTIQGRNKLSSYLFEKAEGLTKSNTNGCQGKRNIIYGRNYRKNLVDILTSRRNSSHVWSCLPQSNNNKKAQTRTLTNHGANWLTNYDCGG